MARRARNRPVWKSKPYRPYHRKAKPGPVKLDSSTLFPNLKQPK